MSLRTIVPVAIVLVLGGGAALLEYGQYSSLMLNTASADVAQLCAGLAGPSACPSKLTLSSKPAIDPWKRAYRCRAANDGVLVYTLGADNKTGGERRDADIACTNAPSGASGPSDECVCRVGGSAFALVR